MCVLVGGGGGRGYSPWLYVKENALVGRCVYYFFGERAGGGVGA